jgi:hypothetical protein
MGGAALDTESEPQVAGMLLRDRTSQQQSYDHQRGDGSVELEPPDLGNSLHIPYKKGFRQCNYFQTMYDVTSTPKGVTVALQPLPAK